mgnify:CR=1 FL=1
MPTENKKCSSKTLDTIDKIIDILSGREKITVENLNVISNNIKEIGLKPHKIDDAKKFLKKNDKILVVGMLLETLEEMVKAVKTCFTEE